MANTIGPEVAAPLKQVIAQTEGLTLVGAVPIGEKTTLSFILEGTRPAVKHIARVPGETLFLALAPSSYDFTSLNTKLGEIMGKFGDDEAFYERLIRLDGRDSSVTVPSFTYRETDPDPISIAETESFGTSSPFLSKLLSDGGIKVGETYHKTNNYEVSRDTEVVLYPSQGLAELALDFNSLKSQHKLPRFAYFQGTLGAWTVLEAADFRRLASLPATGEKEQAVLLEVAQKYVPGYSPRIASVSAA